MKIGRRDLMDKMVKRLIGIRIVPEKNEGMMHGMN